MHCVDLETGRELWQGGKSGSPGSCILTQDERLVTWTDKGNLSLAETYARSPKKYTELASQRGMFRTDAWPHVVLAEGRLFVKDRNGNLACLTLTGKPNVVAKTPMVPKPVPMPKPVGEETVKSLSQWPGDAGLLLAWERGQKGKVISPNKSLTLASRKSAEWDDQGRMQFSGGAFVVKGADELLLKECRKSNQLGIEAVITSEHSRQRGPARIITFSTDGFSRNFSLAQEGDQLLLRLRTPNTGNNGLNPETKLARVTAKKTTHLVVTYAEGKLACYLDGKLAHETNRVRGDFRNWSAQHLLFGNEWDGGNTRDWHGSLERLALFNRWIGPKEAARRFELFQGDAKSTQRREK